MNPRPDFCPGCGAQVYPEETHCPFCQRRLHASPVTPFLLGLGGAVMALVVGALVWWVLDALPATEASAPPARQEAAAPAEPSSPPAQDGAQAGSQEASQEASRDASPAAAPASAFAPAPADALSTTAFAPSPTAASLISGAAPAAGASAAEAQLPLPTPHGSEPEVAADADARKAFAKSTQERFVENGLDLTVATSGEADTTLTITFNFPAKTAAELIVAGPFPRQCVQRGFKQVVFVDPSGISWFFDLATQQMTQKQ